MNFLRQNKTLAALGLILGLTATTGCGMSYTPGRTAGFEADAAPEINDEDIRKAFEAKPQLPGELRLAYYTFDPAIAKDLETSLAAVPGVKSVYRIPPLLITGERRMEGHHFGGPSRDVTIKKLRLLSARAHADALLVIDHGYRSAGANGFAALNILLVPALFTPFLDNRVEGYAEAFLFDTRNGYLYGHATEEDTRGPSYATIYSKSAHEIAEEQWKDLQVVLQKDVGRLIVSGRAGNPPKGIEAKVAAPAAPSSSAPASR